MRTAAVHSLGCKVNSYETDAMQQMLIDAGYLMVPFSEPADVYVINTCAVTNIADRKSRQMIHRAKKQNPDAVVVAAGCYVQTSPEEAELDPAVDIILGNNRKNDLIRMIDSFLEARSNDGTEPDQASGGKTKQSGMDAQLKAGQKHQAGGQRSADGVRTSGGKHRVIEDRIDISDPDEPYEDMKVLNPNSHTRAFLKIQDGCNQFCSYCIIPYARGRIRSRSIDNILEETKCLADHDFHEIVLTGIHVSSFGKDTGESLLDLIRQVHEVEGIQRIRLSSLEPRIVTPEFASALAELPKVCPHFHLSLQSGSDTVLRRMNRHYTTTEYAEKCSILRSVYKHPAITTDIIVGFPGETPEEFEETLAFAEKIHFYEIHVFRYSRRDGTPAAKMKDQIPKTVQAERSRSLIDLAGRMKQEFVDWYQGKPVEVLIEDRCKINGRSYFQGFTPEYVKVHIPDQGPDLHNQFVTLRMPEA